MVSKHKVKGKWRKRKREGREEKLRNQKRLTMIGDPREGGPSVMFYAQNFDSARQGVSVQGFRG